MDAMRVEVNSDHSKICYIENGNKACEYISPIGMDYLTKNKFSHFSASDFLSYFYFCLHSLKNIRKIPEVFYVDVSDNKVWFENIFLRNNYTQFFDKNISPRVIINMTSSSHPNYERHKKTLHKFKI
jgi:hypothetical protein